ncbi:hypothetical protein C8Q78DRAFT_562666 [Trametes maxima]|nr:hypothetical protein C8Q78DRAFT_562666 [Trametes maxima]
MLRPSSSQYWYEDGNIILIADGDIGFRMHQGGALIPHSIVFQDILIVSLLSDMETCEKCLTVGRQTTSRSSCCFGCCTTCQACSHAGNASLLHHHPPFRARTQVQHRAPLHPNAPPHAHALLLPIIRLQASLSVSPSPAQQRGLRSAAVELVPSHDAIKVVNLVRLADDPHILHIPLYLCRTFFSYRRYARTRCDARGWS